jgi:hypothetical protein
MSRSWMTIVSTLGVASDAMPSRANGMSDGVSTADCA